MKIEKFEYSKSFLREVAKELKALVRTLVRLEERERQLLAEKKSLEAEKKQLDEQIALLDQVIAADSDNGLSSGIVLRGRRIPQAAIEAMLETSTPRQALHYRDWYGLLVSRGFLVMGSKPHATFLASFSRSPVIRSIKGKPGFYAIDFSAPKRIKAELEEAEAELCDMLKLVAEPQFSRVRTQEITNLKAHIRKLKRDLQAADLLTKRLSV